MSKSKSVSLCKELLMKAKNMKNHEFVNHTNDTVGDVVSKNDLMEELQI